MKVWVCVPVFNRIKYTLKFLESVYRQTFTGYEVVICDHGSTDGTSELIIENYPSVTLLKGESNLWWTGAINICVEYALQHGAEDDMVLTLNNDTEIPEGYLANLVSRSREYQGTIITSVVRDIETGDVVSIGYRQNWFKAKEIPITLERDHLANNDRVAEVTHASGRGTMYPLSVYKEIGLYDERHFPHYGADYDFSQRARRAGYPIYVCADCEVFSHVTATGMTAVRKSFSLTGFKDYLFGMKSPANIRVRWWYGWNNCSRMLFPLYVVIDLFRVIGSYFKYFARE